MSLSPILAIAQTTWDGDTSSDWTDPANWSAGVPTAADSVTIPSGTPFSPELTVAPGGQCASLTLASGASLLIAPLTTLEVSGGASLSGAITGSGTLSFVGSGSATLTAAETLPRVTVSKVGSLSISGTVTVAIGFVLSSGTLSVGGTLRIEDPADFLGGTLAGSGILDLDGSATFGGTSVTTPPSIQFSGANLELDGNFAPTSGTVTIDGTGSTLSGQPAFFDLVLDNPSSASTAVDMAVANDLLILGNGALSTTASIDVGRDLTLNLGGTFGAGASTHTIARNCALNGFFSGDATMRFVGSSTSTYSGTASYPSVTCDKTGVTSLFNSGAVTIDGDLTLLSGVMSVSSTVVVESDSLFNGGSLTGSGTLDMNGDVRFDGCSSVSPPTITCAGDWTADGAFNPTAGTVTFDGPPGPELIVTGTAAQVTPIFNALTIAPSAKVRNTSKLLVRSTFTVGGVLTSAESLDVNGTMTVSSGAVWTADDFTHTLARSLSISGTVTGTGTFVFDGNSGGTLSVSSPSPLPNLVVQKAGGNTLTMSGSMTVDGTLELLSGNLTRGANSTTVVTGNCTFAGGNLTGSSSPTPPVLDVGGSVEFSGTVALDPPVIRCAGNWTANDLFHPNNRRVVFDGTSPQVILGTAAHFYELEFAQGANVSTLLDVDTGSTTTVSGSFTTTGAVDSLGTFSIGAQGAFLGGAQTHRFGSTFSCSGNLTATGEFVFYGDVSGSVSSNKDLPDVRVVKVAASSQTLSSITIDGDLTLVSGPLSISGTTEVLGDASFHGGSLSGSGTIDVGGDVLFAGASALVSATSQPNFRCAGSWTAHPGYKPLSGTATFDGPGGSPSSIIGAGAHFFGLEVANGSELNTAIDLVVRGPLTVRGAFDTTGVLDVDGVATVDTGAQMLTHAGTHRFGAALTAPGGAVVAEAAGMFIFDGPTSGSLSSIFALPSVTIAKTDGGVLSTASSTDPQDPGVAVAGDMTLVSGTLSVSSADMDVAGDAMFSGGILTGSTSRTIVVEGDITFNGTFSSTPPDIEARGGWNANPLFQPVQAEVVFNGSPDAQVIDGSFGNFADLRIVTSAEVTSNLPMALTGDLVVTNGKLKLTSTMPVPIAGDVTSSGTFESDAPLHVDGTVNVTSGSFDVAGGSFGDDLILLGGFGSTGPIVMTGGQTATLQSISDLPKVTIAKALGATVSTSGTLTIGGDLDVVSGTLSVGGTTTIEGSATFAGGTLAGGGTLAVDGDVVFAGTIATAPPNLVVDGDFTLHPLFVPQSRTVTFAGAPNPQSIFGSGVFWNLEVVLFGNVQAGGDLVTHDFTTLGQFDANGGALLVRGDAVVGSGSAAFIGGAADHVFEGDLTVDGNLSASGTFIFSGFDTATLTSIKTLPPLSLEKDGAMTLGAISGVNGDLTMKSGTVSIASSAGVPVSGDANFEGGTLSGSTSGTLDVAGDVTFSGTRVLSTPMIRCGGDWTGDVNFNPTSGTIVFDGTSPQVISGNDLTFASVRIEQNAEVSTVDPISIDGTFDVDGTWQTTANMEFSSTVTVNTSGALDLGDATHQFRGSLTCAGPLTATGEFVFSGTTSTVSISSALALPSVTLEGTGSVRPIGVLQVVGDLRLLAGSIDFTSGSDQLLVSGDATFEGGVLSGSSTYTLDVEGDVTFTGSTATFPPTIRCGGSWRSDVNFTPVSGTVELDGLGSGIIESLTPNQATSFSILNVISGDRTVIGQMEVRGISMLVQTGGSLTIAENAAVSIDDATVTVFGTLALDGGGTLRLGAGADVTIEEIGFLDLLGQSGVPAVIDGLDGGGYGFVLKGNVSAHDFLVRQPDENGFVIESTATIDTELGNEFRAGLFDEPRNVPGATLLRVTRPVPTEFRDLTFQNSANAINVSNVKVTGGSALTLLNAKGTFSGETFEDDVLGLVAWTSGSQTQLQSLSAVTGPGEVTVRWTTLSEELVAEYVVERTGPDDLVFVPLATVPAAGPSSYEVTATGLLPKNTYFFRLSEKLVDTTVTELGAVSAVPVDPVLPPNIVLVDPGQSIQAAIHAITEPNSVILVEGGTYPAFTVNAPTAGGLRIVADGSGTVVIDTAVAPVVIANVTADRYVELGNLTIGNSASANGGVAVQDSAGLVLLDELLIEGGPGVTGVAVSNSTATVMQRCQVSVPTGVGVHASASSRVTLGRTSASSVTADASSLVTCQLIGPPPVLTNGATATDCGGVMPDLQIGETTDLSQPVPVTFTGAPFTAWLLVLGTPYGYAELTGLAQMPLVLSLSQPLTIAVTSVTDGAGIDQLSFTLPPDGNLIGTSFGVQAANLLGPVIRLSNGAALTAIP